MLDIDYEGTIRPAIEKHRDTDSRRAAYEKKIVEKWGEDWRIRVDPTGQVLLGRNPEKMLGRYQQISVSGSGWTPLNQSNST